MNTNDLDLAEDDGEDIEDLDRLVSVLNLSRTKEAILVGGYTHRGVKIYRAVNLGDR